MANSSTGLVPAGKSNTGKANSTTAPAEVPVKGLVIGEPITGRTLPAVSGKGRRPTPCPADLRAAVEHSISNGGIAVPMQGTQRDMDKVKRDLAKYRKQQEEGGRMIHFDYRTDPAKPKPTTNESGYFEVYGNLVSGPANPV